MLAVVQLALLAVAVSTADPAGELQLKINAAVASKAQKLKIPGGDYYFGNKTLLVQDATNLRLEADGPVTFWFTNSDGGFMVRRCSNVTISGMNSSGKAGLRIDRSPPPFVQGTVTKVTDGMVEFTLDGDSADPRSKAMTTLSRDPSRGSGGMQGTECYTWEAGSHPADGRQDSHGIPKGGRFCPAIGPNTTNANFKEIGPNKFQHAFKGSAGVGDQFVSVVWKGFSYVIANSSAVTTEDVSVHAAGYMAVAEMDGKGAHVYRNVKVVPRNGRIISSNVRDLMSSR